MVEIYINLSTSTSVYPASASRRDLCQINTVTYMIKHSVTKGHYFSKKPMIKKFSKLKSFTLKWSRVLKIDKYHFLFHFSKHSICTKVVLSSPNLTDIDQDTKIDPFSIVFFVFHKALVPFRQI